LEATVLQWISQYGYAGIVLLMMFGIIGVPIPDEVLLTFSGYLVFKGELSFAPTIASAFSGSICGITVSYLLGRTGGRYLAGRYGSWFHITKKELERVHDWLERSGRWGIFFGYFVPGLRHLTALVAGTSRLRYPIFAAFAYAGGLLWSTSFITAGFFLGKEWRKVSPAAHRWGLLALGTGVGIVAVCWLWREARRKK
jgi:membrane protein DedA with SNARE-associated domain